MTSALEKLLCKVLPYRDIVKKVDGQDTLYLRRFFLWRRDKSDGKTGDGGGLFLHVIHRSDDDPDPHDHPWDFTSFVLSGGYLDEQPEFRQDATDGLWDRVHTVLELVSPLRMVHRKAEHLHRVILGKTVAEWRDGAEERPAWTIVFTGPRRREWGFFTLTGWESYRKYLKLDKEAW